jgi:hypothetical protein
LQKSDYILRIALHDAAQTIGDHRIHCSKSGDAVFEWTICDVFVVGAANLLMSEKKSQIATRNKNRRLWKKENVAGFELRAIVPQSRGIFESVREIRRGDGNELHLC